MKFLILFLGIAATAALAQEATAIGGYGELHYNEPDGSQSGTLDFHRFVLYVGHSFTDRISFKSEMEIEHTKIEAGQGGEVAIEQAYLDWHFSEKMGMRAGIILPPIGIINQFHEPPTFNGVERPNVDDVIIPSTWRESGVSVYGAVAEGVRYELGVVAGLRAEGLDSSLGIREGRQEALNSTSSNPSLTGRVDYLPIPELRFGGSFFLGNTTEGVDSLGGGTVSVISGDVRYTYDRASLRAEGAFESIGDATKINAEFKRNVADRIYGYYIEGAYDILPWFSSAADQSLNVFARYEKYDTQAGVSGFAANPVNDRHDITVGATYKPVPGAAFKIDYQFLDNAAGLNAKMFNMGVGYSF